MCAGRAICIVPFDTFIFQETLINRRLNRISTHPIHNLYPHILCLIEDLLNVNKLKLKFWTSDMWIRAGWPIGRRHLPPRNQVSRIKFKTQWVRIVSQIGRCTLTWQSLHARDTNKAFMHSHDWSQMLTLAIALLLNHWACSRAALSYKHSGTVEVKFAHTWNESFSICIISNNC